MEWLRTRSARAGAWVRPLCAVLSVAACNDGPINAVVGDRSWVERHGRSPTRADAEDERHAIHLAWIEEQLRARDVSHLSQTQRSSESTE